MDFYAHTLPGQPKEFWEPLFTPACPTLSGHPCKACQNLDPKHGHLNKSPSTNTHRPTRSTRAGHLNALLEPLFRHFYPRPCGRATKRSLRGCELHVKQIQPHS